MKIIGQGSYGQVELCEDQHPPIVAKHILQPFNLISRGQFEKEWKTLKELRHENIVNFLRWKEIDNHYVIFMEFCERLSLRKVFEDPTVAYNMKTVLCWAEHLLSVLSYLKENKILHRDIKTENVLVNYGFVLKLADFGCVREVDEFTKFTLIGTMRYMSPEAYGCRDKRIVNYQSDLYAVGLILWEIIERRLILTEYGVDEFDYHPFFTNFRLNFDQKLETFQMPDCTHPIKDVVMRCLQYRFEDRPQVEDLHSQVQQLNLEYQASGDHCWNCSKFGFHPMIREDQKEILRPLGFDGTDNEVPVLIEEAQNEDILLTTLSSIHLSIVTMDAAHVFEENSQEPEIPSSETIESPRSGQVEEAQNEIDEVNNLYKENARNGVKQAVELLKNKPNTEEIIKIIQDTFQPFLKYEFFMEDYPKFPNLLNQSLMETIEMVLEPPELASQIISHLKAWNRQIAEDYMEQHSLFVETITYIKEAGIARDQTWKNKVSKFISKCEKPKNFTIPKTFYLSTFQNQESKREPLWFLISRRKKLLIRADFEEIERLQGIFLDKNRFLRSLGVPGENELLRKIPIPKATFQLENLLKALKKLKDSSLTVAKMKKALWWFGGLTEGPDGPVRPPFSNAVTLRQDGPSFDLQTLTIPVGKDLETLENYIFQMSVPFTHKCFCETKCAKVIQKSIKYFECADQVTIDYLKLYKIYRNSFEQLKTWTNIEDPESLMHRKWQGKLEPALKCPEYFLFSTLRSNQRVVVLELPKSQLEQKIWCINLYVGVIYEEWISKDDVSPDRYVKISTMDLAKILKNWKILGKV